MMNIIEFLSSINIIAGVTLGVVIIVLIYEIRSLKLNKPVSKKILVPDYDKKKVYAKVESTDISYLIKKDVKKDDPSKKQKIILFLSFLILVLLIIIGLNMSLFKKKLDTTMNNQTTPNTKIVKSNGIVIYNENWKPLNEEQIILTIHEKRPLFIGIQSIGKGLIDKARIRVNESSWSAKHETTLFNKEQNVYYTEYTVASKGVSLIIEAQLHSQEDGWLGE